MKQGGANYKGQSLQVSQVFQQRQKEGIATGGKIIPRAATLIRLAAVIFFTFIFEAANLTDFYG